ncbi:MAG: multidrug ABC transporter permease [Proteobacteria bacterium]|nr:MAG: multidrug ABC transporter permease [Pseudomonadota bacterium]
MSECSDKPGLIALLRSERQLLLSDPWLFASVTFIPVALFVFFLLLFRQGIVHELPLAVVDYDNSSLSRSLLMALDGDDSLQLRVMPSEQDAATALRGGQVYGTVTIPARFEQNVIKGFSPRLTTRCNYQFVLVGKILDSATKAVIATFNASLATEREMRSGSPVPLQAMGEAVPSRRQITSLYNTGLDYSQFLVTAILPAIWQIIMVSAMVLVWAAEERRTGVDRWLLGFVVPKMLVRLIFYQVIFLALSLFFLSLFASMGWPMNGEIRWVLFSQWLTILACQGVATLVYLLVRDPARALGVAAAYTAPGFAFMGVTFPLTDMDLFARSWNAILPIASYMEVQISVLNHAAPLSAIVPSLVNLAAFLPVYILVALVIWRVRNKNRGAVL